MHFSTKIDLLKALYVTIIILANLLGSKITTMFGISVSVGIFMVPVAFLITDILEEIIGKNEIKKLIVITASALIITFLFVLLSLSLPPNARFAHNDEYTIVFSASTRMIIASLVAFILSQTNDAYMFDFIKGKTHGKHLWLRNNLSTMTSQFIDTVVFMFIAFYQITPKFTFGFIWQLIIPYFIFKIVFALIDTPFFYAGVKWLKSSKDYEEA